ncbi:MAG: flagellar basal body-associated FliL family protein [Alphaproteobacteria bacterium]|nr:flagellar basal body-associated FliL family protein [Alphaproteobacteria bacterium]
MTDDTADAELEAGGSKKRLAGKKIVLFALPVVLLVAGGAGAYFMGLFGGEAPPEEQAAAAESAGAAGAAGEQGGGDEVVYFEVPDLLVNLSGPDNSSGFLKLRLQLELEESGDVEKVEAVLPRIIDNFQVYLRELRVEDLQGAQGVYRLKEELLVRVNAAARPTKINDVLISEMLVQ